MPIMRRGLVSLGLGLCVLGVPAALRAATYVVDGANPAAADSNAGSEDAPWKTIQYAADKAAPGDTVLVCEGTYPEHLTLKKSGTQEQWITLKSAPARGAQLIGINAGRTQFVRIEGFKLVNPDKSVRGGGFNVGNADHIDILNNYIENAGVGITGGRTLMDESKGHSPTGIRIGYNDIYHCEYGILAAGTKWLLESNEIHRLFNYGSDDDDYTRAFGEGHEYRFNFFHGSKASEIGKSHVDIVQFFDNNGEYVKDLFIHDNVFTDFHQGLMAEMHHPGHAGNLTFKQNIYYTADPWGAWGLCDEDIPGVVAERNTYFGIAWFGVGITGDKVTGGVIRNNIFDHIDQAVKVDKDGKKNGTVIEGNILYQINHKDRDLGATDKVNVDPQLVDPEHGNFRLRAGSPAIKGGAGGETIGALDYPNVYYVDPRHPGASDESFGYAGRPFKTLAKALATAKSGETILLRGGVYREMLRPGGESVTVRPVEGDVVVISGADLVEGWKKDGGGWSAVVAAKPVKLLKDGKAVSDFTYDAGAKKLTVTAGDPRVHVWETVVREHAIDLAGAKNVTVENLAVTNTLADAVVPGEGNSLKKLITISSGSH